MKQQFSREELVLMGACILRADPENWGMKTEAWELRNKIMVMLMEMPE